MTHRFVFTTPVFMVGLLLGWCGAARAESPGGFQPPATQPAGAAAPAGVIDPAGAIDPAVQALLDQLGHTDAAVREAASGKLSAMGKAILPALKQAAESDDPEVKARARALVRHAERRLPPGAPRDGGRWGVGHAVSVRRARDRRVIEVDDDGRKIQITRRNDGSIDMTVTGVDAAGNEATESYQADDDEQLKRDNPEAYALYERWQDGGDRLRSLDGLADLAAGRAAGVRIPIGVGDAPPEGLFEEARRQIRRDLERARVPREHIDALVDQLRGLDRGPGRAEIDKLREQLLRPRDEQGRLKPEAEALKGEVQELKARAGEDLDRERGDLRRALEQDREQIAKLNEELRRQFQDIRDLGLVRPEAIGARPMLGVAVAEVDAGGGRALTVLRVVPGSRAAKIGIEEGDVLRRLNGKDVEGVRGLQDRVAEVLGGEKPERVVVEVEREGKALKLEEKCLRRNLLDEDTWGELGVARMVTGGDHA